MVVSKIISKKMNMVGRNSGVSKVVCLKDFGYDGYLFVEVDKRDKMFELLKDIIDVRDLIKFDNEIGVLKENEIKTLGLVS